jgi:SAM-dependent methyltransferase
MTNYRSIFYKNYSATQSARGVANIAQKFAQEQQQFTHEILPLLPTNPRLNILDIGCGNGSLLGALAAAGYTHTQGIDIAPDQVAIAHQMGVTQVQQADLLPYLDKNPQQFDVILAMDIIEHFTKDELVILLEKIRNALKINGLCIIRTPNADAVFASIFIAGDFTHENQLNGYSAKQVLGNCGFDGVDVLPARVHTQGIIKEIIRKIMWWHVVFYARLIIFASGRSSGNVVFTPNLIIKAIRK